MLEKQFDPKEIYFRCVECGKGHPRDSIENCYKGRICHGCIDRKGIKLYKRQH